MSRDVPDRPRIVVSGWYGNNNLGDELILQAIVTGLRDRLPSSHVTVLSFRPDATAAAHGVAAEWQIPVGWTEVKPWASFILRGRFLGTLRAIAECDVFVLGGGGFLSDWQQEVPIGWLKQLVIARLYGKKTMLFAIGTGPFLTSRGRRWTGALVRRFSNAITVRDVPSMEWLVRTGVPPGRIGISADPVFALPSSKREGPPESAAPARVALIIPEMFDTSLWHNADRKHAEWVSLWVAVVDGLKERQLSTDLVAFHPVRDMRLLNTIKYMRPEAQITPWNDIGAEEAQRRLQSYLCVVSGRYHGIILAALAGTPTLGVVTHHKLDALLSALGAREFSTEIGDGAVWPDRRPSAEPLLAGVDHIRVARQEFARRQEQARAMLTETASSSFARLMRLLETRPDG